jgi:hypothetical protein
MFKRTLKADGANANSVSTEIERAWKKVQGDPDIVAEASDHGLDTKIFAAQEPPFEAQPETSPFLISGTILIAAAGALGEHTLERGADWLWDKYIWPKVKIKLQGRVTEQ